MPTVTRCSTINVSWNDRTTANPASQPPYTLYAVRGGSPPLVVGTTSARTLGWRVQLPAGGPYLVGMSDSNGYTGGVRPFLLLLIFNARIHLTPIMECRPPSFLMSTIRPLVATPTPLALMPSSYLHPVLCEYSNI